MRSSRRSSRPNAPYPTPQVRTKAHVWLAGLLAASLIHGVAVADDIVVGSKIFTEGYVKLAELAAQSHRGIQAPRAGGAQARHGQHRNTV